MDRSTSVSILLPVRASTEQQFQGQMAHSCPRQNVTSSWKGKRMAKYVLVEFDDDKDAEFFMKSLAVGSVFIEYGDDSIGGEYGYVDKDKARTKAFFQKPTKFCQCKRPSDRQPLGKKYGIRVCTYCRFPIRRQWQHPRNLMLPEDFNPKYRTLYLGVVEGADQDDVQGS